VKLDCSGLHAFDSPNYPPIATTGINIAMDDKLIMRRAKVTQKLTIHTDLVENIVVISMNPLINADMLRKLANPSIQAVVLQTYGVGNIPDLPDIIEAITEVASHCIVVNVTSCYKGGINDAYYCGRILKKMGVVSGSDMTIECTMVKLSYLLGKYRGDTEKVKALIG
jgi:L-asparaginase/Glu-tRNA(Gln) amidotransferase subunit D